MTDAPISILCVEDDRDSRDAMTLMLQQDNPAYNVTTVGTAAEALELVLRKVYDLFVLDIWLPGMDGLSLCRRLRDHGIKSPIVFFSAMVRPTDKEYSLQAGANEFLVKPHDVDKFTATVARLLNHHKSTPNV
ncbi:MAG: response regulator [Acidobacteria bacterium]|nr:response regulator [Acidobacteriota bacterium]MCA1608365.1 response regulator [Acidobacteriota bacterium]